MITQEYIPSEHRFQVLLSVYNAEKYILRCLESLNESLRGYDWILLYGDDQSEDGSTMEMAKFARQLNCDKVHLFEYDKATNVSEAKNRLIKEAHKHKRRYPYILFMDADDEMLPARPKMVNYMDGNQYVLGSYDKINTSNNKSLVKSTISKDRLGYGPWATLFHCDFLPEDGKFFPEDEVCNTGFSDILTWYHLKYINNQPPAIDDSLEPVHKYVERDGSTCRQHNVSYQRNLFWGISNLIKNNKRDIFKNPPSRQEAEEAMNSYIESKKQKNGHNPFD